MVERNVGGREVGEWIVVERNLERRFNLFINSAKMRHLEWQEARALCQWWALACRKFEIYERILFHVGNETGGAGARRGWMNKQIGVRAGTPDYVLLVPRGGYNGLVLELKAGKGRPSPAQTEFMDAVAKYGYLTHVAYGWDAAREAIENYIKFGRVYNASN